ncbi:MAG: lipid-A-disaccharide synthase [Candidatus Omnitrophica bacterium]|nr:lipid-A-disaccharide synthase [Candidatus Omnitrophota bacterium]
MHLCFVAGDPSGDAHAARLIQALRRRRPDLACSGLGGPAMRQAGVALLDDLTTTAAIGPFDAARHLRRLLRAKRLLAEHLKTQRPDALLLVDFGDYNLPVIAPLAHRVGVPVLYYISPQLWAWGRWRLRYVRRYVRRMLVFFSFEERFYREAGVPVTWVGHPLADEAAGAASREALLERLGLNPWRMTVGLLPGSREGEVRRHLPLMLAVAQRMAWRMPGVQFLLLRAPGLEEVVLASTLNTPVQLHLTEGAAEALPALDVALVASGTATLETALAGVPMAVVYRTSWPTYLVARAAVRLPRIALVNVVAQRAVVPEFVQHRARPQRIADTLIDLLRDNARREQMKRELARVKEALGPPGATERAAEAVLGELTAAAGRSSVRSR